MNDDLQSPVVDIYEIWIHVSVLHRFTARITELMKVLKELHTGKYERTMVTQQEKGTQDFLLQHRIVLFSRNWSYTANSLMNICFTSSFLQSQTLQRNSHWFLEVEKLSTKIMW